MTFPFYKPEETNIDGTPKLSAWDATKPSYEIPITPPKPTADELIQKFYSSAPPTPVFDEAKADRLRRMGRINQLGQGVKVLGDIFSTAIGGNVRRRQPDTTAPALYQSYQGMLDRYEAQKDAYRQQKYNKELQNTQFGIQRADRDTAIKMAEKKQEELNKAKERDYNLNVAKWSADYDLKLRAMKLSEKKAGNDSYFKGENLKIQQQKAGAGKEAKPFDPIQVKDKFGNNVKLEQGDWDKIYQNAMKDPEFLKTHFPALKSTFEAVPAELLKQTARSYYEYTQAKELKQSEQDALNKQRIDRGMNTGPISNELKPNIPTPQNKVPTNTTKKTLDYSKIY